MKNLENTLTKLNGLYGFDVYFKSTNGDLLSINDYFINVYGEMSIEDGIVYNADCSSYSNISTAIVTDNVEIDGYLYYFANDDFDEEDGFEREFREKLDSEDVLIRVFEGKSFNDFYKIGDN